MEERNGACRCGNVRYKVTGSALRIGICHCTDCRQESGSAFTFYGIWPTESFSSNGATATYAGRQYCPSCGSHLFCLEAGEAEIKLGSLSEAPSGLTPSYELWIKRREPWLPPISGARQYEEDRLG